MEGSNTVIISVVGIANVVTIGSLVFAAGGLYSKVKTLVVDVEKQTEELTVIRMKIVRLESMTERRKFARHNDTDSDSDRSS